jgi:hypothetical protein
MGLLTARFNASYKRLRPPEGGLVSCTQNDRLTAITAPGDHFDKDAALVRTRWTRAARHDRHVLPPFDTGKPSVPGFAIRFVRFIGKISARGPCRSRVDSFDVIPTACRICLCQPGSDSPALSIGNHQPVAILVEMSLTNGSRTVSREPAGRADDDVTFTTRSLSRSSRRPFRAFHRRCSAPSCHRYF